MLPSGSHIEHTYRISDLGYQNRDFYNILASNPTKRIYRQKAEGLSIRISQLLMVEYTTISFFSLYICTP